MYFLLRCFSFLKFCQRLREEPCHSVKVDRCGEAVTVAGPAHLDISRVNTCFGQSFVEQVTLAGGDQGVFIAVKYKEWRIFSIHIGGGIRQCAFVGIFLDRSAYQG